MKIDINKMVFIQGINDYYHNRNGVPQWMTSEEKIEWALGFACGKSRDFNPRSQKDGQPFPKR